LMLGNVYEKFDSIKQHNQRMLLKYLVVFSTEAAKYGPSR